MGKGYGEGYMYMSRFFACLCVASLILTGVASAGSVLGEGEIDKDLKYEDFQVGGDGYATGYIVNTSNKPRPAVKLDMWTTNLQETRIFWRKSLSVGDLAPGQRYKVREAYTPNENAPQKVKFMFRIPSKANFRN
jgi:hypothetical protein